MASIAAYEHGRAGESYNIGTGVTTSFNEIAKLVISISKSDSRIIYVKNPFKNYQMFTKANMTKTYSELHFIPQFSLNDAIRETIE